MYIRILLIGIFALTQMVAAEAKPEDTRPLSERADAHAHSISDAESFIQEVDDALDLARRGEYGKIKSADMSTLSDSRDRMAALLDGRATARELLPDQRIELYNAQEAITAILRSDDKNRRVCKRVHSTGTRLAKAECLTVAEREQRARQARIDTADWQRQKCILGSANGSDGINCGG